MKYNNTISILKTVINAIKYPTIITDKLGITEILNLSTTQSTNKNTANFSSNTNKLNKEQYTENVLLEDSISSSNDKNYNYYNTKQDSPSNSQGVIDSIANELTSVRLQQAIILSEIVGKPKSKTRKRKKF